MEFQKEKEKEKKDLLNGRMMNDHFFERGKKEKKSTHVINVYYLCKRAFV